MRNERPDNGNAVAVASHSAFRIPHSALASIHSAFRIPHSAFPSDAVLAVTYRCNARCVMCGIWKSAPAPEAPPEVYRKLPASLRDVNLSGGEPFLRDDLPQVHEAVRHACPRSRTIISTNGLLTDRILSQARAMAKSEPAIGLAISLDGPAEVHDRMRGVHGAFQKATATLRALQDAGFANLRLAFTATPENCHCLAEMYEMAGRLGVEFTCTMEHGSEHYFHRQAPDRRIPPEILRRQIAPVIRHELRRWSPKRWARAYYLFGLYQHATAGGRLLPCLAGRDFFFMDPSANVYACNAAPFRMGNLGARDFAGIWASPDGLSARTQAARCEAGCWMICTCRTAIRRNWARVLAWAIAHRLRRLPMEKEPA